jgi:acyl-[acyl-carrier-protein]-phospholipid O-acyltransferase / long-chain-fatty-acid--[acyl-carrier-protein] ligase
MKHLFRTAGFIPYVLILFLNASTDLAHKITIQNVLVKSFEGDTLIILSAIINAMILLPFILLFSPSGFISDKFSKTSVVKYAAFSSIFLTLIITLSYSQGWFITAFIMTFLLAVQSTIYSPSKYGMIKEMVGVDDLARANAVVQSTTIVAILVSSLVFAYFFMQLYVEMEHITPENILPYMVPLGWAMVVFTVIETLLTLKLPKLIAHQPDDSFKFRTYIQGHYLKVNIGRIFHEKSIFRSIIGLSIFMGVGQLMLAAFPAHYKLLTGSDNVLVIQGILALSAVGIVIGSLIAGRLSKHHIELGIVPIGGFGVAMALLMFATTTSDLMFSTASLVFGFFGGFIMVALNANIQFHAHEDELGRVLAGNNFIQNILMTLFLFTTIVLVELTFSTIDIFYFASFAMLITALWGIKLMPSLVLRMVLLPLLKFKAKIVPKGLEHLPKKGGVLLLGNHISWVDWLIIQLATPRSLTFVMERAFYNKWYLHWFLRQFDIIPICEKASKEAMIKIRERLDRGNAVCLFPEGMISYTKEINRFKKGFERPMKGASHPIIPFHLDGLWSSRFSRAPKQERVKSKFWNRRLIVVSYGQALTSDSSAEMVEQAVRELS